MHSYILIYLSFHNACHDRAWDHWEGKVRSYQFHHFNALMCLAPSGSGKARYLLHIFAACVISVAPLQRHRHMVCSDYYPSLITCSGAIALAVEVTWIIGAGSKVHWTPGPKVYSHIADTSYLIQFIVSLVQCISLTSKNSDYYLPARSTAQSLVQGSVLFHLTVFTFFAWILKLF